MRPKNDNLTQYNASLKKKKNQEQTSQPVGFGWYWNWTNNDA